jgi:alpha-glucosidase
MSSNVKWWQEGVIYQIYPRSFFDSNDDGVGDLRGIICKLGYLKWLGITAIWLNPINNSPMKDGGYDISNYLGIDPLFGHMDDFDELIDEIHRLEMKLILDFVPNHTSHEHPWFRESKLSRDNDKSDWYIWKDPLPGGGAPNNWLSNFGGPAWTYDINRNQYYYHAFHSSQPDLNWRNSQVQKAMLDSMKFWLDKGVDGFRVDVIWHIIKDEEFRDNPIYPDYGPHMAPHRKLLEVYSSDRPEVHEIIEMMRHVLDGYENRMMVGEIYLPLERLVAYYGSEGKGVHMPFNFSLFHTPWNPLEMANVIDSYEAQLPDHGWPNWVLGNHDFPRLASRIGDSDIRLACLLLLTLRGTPTIYYGEEIGMHDVHIPEEEIQDCFEKNVPKMGLGRDPQRTPFLWNNLSNAGFSKVKPWLRIEADYELKNLQVQLEDPKSLLYLYRKLIYLRKDLNVLVSGDYKCEFVSENIFFYSRSTRDQKIFVLLNFGASSQILKWNHSPGKVILSTFSEFTEVVNSEINLRPKEGVIIRMN